MTKFCEIDFDNWFINRMEAPLISASVNPDYEYNVVKETEKAIKLHIFRKGQEMTSAWTKWFPKSAIKNLDDAMKEENNGELLRRGNNAI